MIVSDVMQQAQCDQPLEKSTKVRTQPASNKREFDLDTNVQDVRELLLQPTMNQKYISFKKISEKQNLICRADLPCPATIYMAFTLY